MTVSIGIVVNSTSVEATPLQDVMQTKPYKKIERTRGRLSSLYSEKWFQPGSSFEAVFKDPKSGSVLLDWLGVLGSGLTPGATESRRLHEYVRAERSLMTKELKKLLVKALVPHPKYAETATLGLIDAFVAHEPPKLKILFSETLKFGDVEGTLYHQENGSCSLVVRGVKGALVILETASCHQKEDLLTLASKLDFKRFNERLNS